MNKNSLNTVFRVDASLKIGAGHVMRCLTLADRIKDRGGHVLFICSSIIDDLRQLISERGYKLISIKKMDQKDDAREVLSIINEEPWQLVVVDNYTLDKTWESVIKDAGHPILAIDDWPNRKHNCTLLLDQTYGREAREYKGIVPLSCHLLLGSKYSLLRDDFRNLRDESIKRRNSSGLKDILISLGGSDIHNVTARVLAALANSELPHDCKITVLLGYNSKWKDEIQSISATMKWTVEIRNSEKNIARLMSEADLAIGAAGTTSWERCCLGLPSIILVLAENQEDIAKSLASANAVLNAGSPESCDFEDTLVRNINNMVEHPELVKSISAAAAKITDGHGVVRVLDSIERIL